VLLEKLGNHNADDEEETVMASSSRGKANAVDTEFQSAVSNMMAPYLRGYYSIALNNVEEACKTLRDSTPEKRWQYVLLSVWREFLTDWDVDAAGKKLQCAAEEIMKGQQDAAPNYKYFYLHLFKACICGTEQTNLAALHEAANSATTCSKIFDTRLEGQSFAELAHLDQYNYYPPAWCIYWYRAQTRDVLGLGDDALEDYTRAYRELVKDMAHGFVSEGSSIGDLHGLREQMVTEMATGRWIWPAVITFCQVRAPIASRFLSDMGMFLFRRGDWETAKSTLRAAASIDDQNPYTRANYGSVLSYDRDEEAALPVLAEAYRLFREACENEKGAGKEFVATGRVYYQIGLFAYKILRADVIATDENERKRLGQVLEQAMGKEGSAEAEFAGTNKSEVGHAIRQMSAREFRGLFDKRHVERCLGLFQKAAECYLQIKDLTRTLPALVLFCDPLDPEVMQGKATSQRPVKAARLLLWDLAYGMGPEFIGNLVRFLNRVDQYLTRERSQLGRRP